jgi:hypothetical protein
MGEIVSLKLKRKQIQRAEKQQTAEANRQKFGRSKAEKSATILEQQRAQKSLDALKREK